MGLIKYKRNFEPFPNSFNGLVDRFFNDAVQNNGSRFIPSVDVVESDKNYEIHVAIPGIDKNDINLEINDDTLSISGERKITAQDNEKNYRSIETQYGSFKRTFQLPKDVNVSKIDASYNNGILKVELPKDLKKETKSTITIK